MINPDYHDIESLEKTYRNAVSYFEHDNRWDWMTVHYRKTYTYTFDDSVVQRLIHIDKDEPQVVIHNQLYIDSLMMRVFELAFFQKEDCS